VLGQELRKAREAAGLTQEELAFKANISREYVNYVERDKRNITVKTLAKVCKALGISPGKLILKVEGKL
jgi:transcriptional regulator with XRE-family HTH domain